MKKDNVVKLPKLIDPDLEWSLLDNAIECNECGKKLFYIVNNSVICYKCKTAYNLKK